MVARSGARLRPLVLRAARGTQGAVTRHDTHGRRRKLARSGASARASRSLAQTVRRRARSPRRHGAAMVSWAALRRRPSPHPAPGRDRPRRPSSSCDVRLRALMATFVDLGPIDYFPVADSRVLRAVGWLARGQDFSRREVSREFFSQLCHLLVSPWEPCAVGGVHDCDLCQFSGGLRQLRFGDAIVTRRSAARTCGRIGPTDGAGCTRSAAQGRCPAERRMRAARLRVRRPERFANDRHTQPGRLLASTAG